MGIPRINVHQIGNRNIQIADAYTDNIPNELQETYLKEIVNCLNDFPNLLIICDQTYSLQKPTICLSHFLEKQSIIISNDIMYYRTQCCILTQRIVL